MFDLDKIKVVFIDFDDTILLWNYRENNPDYWESMFEKDSSFYDRKGRLVGLGIREFLEACKVRDIKVYVLTWGQSNVHYHAQKGWLDKTFGEDAIKDVMITSSKDYKVEILKVYHGVYRSLRRSEIMFIDDVCEIVGKAYEEGFTVASPQEIALHYGGK